MRIPTLTLIFALLSCTDGPEPCIDAPTINEGLSVEIERLEDKLFKAKSPRDIEEFLRQYPILAREFLAADQYPSDSVLARQIFRVINNPYTDTLLKESKTYFADMADLKSDFEEAFSYIHHYYPDFKAPKIQTLVTGFGSSEMYVDDDQIIIGLEFYLGEKAKYRPQGIPLYILQRYDKPYIVPAAILLYAERYLRENPSDNSMAADMIYYGKKYLFAKNMLPCTADSLLIWYDGKELANVENNRKLLWYYFLENELLYESNHIIKQKYLDERPNVFEIGNDCPGRIGAWIGWDIVRTYHENNPEISLQQLLANSDAQDLLNQAKYNPR